MMTFAELLHEHKDAVVRRWLESTLATYSGNAAATFASGTDRFANPIGHSVRQGTRGVLDALLDGTGTEAAREHLCQIIKVRAVQELSASDAVGFVFGLKSAIRAELGDKLMVAQVASGWLDFQEKIDRMALVAFDIFVECRERLSELRINEAKRQMPWILERTSQRVRESQECGGTCENRVGLPVASVNLPTGESQE